MIELKLNEFYGDTNNPPIVVVRVRTSYWHDKKGGHIRKDINYLKRKSRGYNVLDEDMYLGSADLVLPTIINLYDVEDGIYELITVNESRDWETGYIDSYDMKLIPYKENPDTNAGA